MWVQAYVRMYASMDMGVSDEQYRPLRSHPSHEKPTNKQTLQKSQALYKTT